MRVIDHKYNPRRFILLDVAASCDADSITYKDPVSGSSQCQDCRKCPAGQGLSVNCGDVIPSSTPVMCKPCVLGETYSSAYEAGACKDCENCGPYRETIKACTLTSKAVCGKCKVSAYEEPMLGMCRPCSPCCNDGKDIVISKCKVPGVPKNMQCTFMRSEKCGKQITKAVISTTAAALQTTWPSTVPTTHNEKRAPIPENVKSADEQQVYPSESSTKGATNGPTNGSSLNWVIAVTVVVGVLLILVAVPAALKYRKARRKRVCTNDDIELQRVQTNDEVNASDGNETDEANPEDALLENTQVLPLHATEKTLDSPLLTGTDDDTKTQQVRDEIDEPNPEGAQVPFSVQESPSESPLLTGTKDDTKTRQVKANGGGDQADVPNPVEANLGDTQESTGVEETLDSPLPTGTEETQEPGPHCDTGKPQECLLMSIIFET